MFQRAGISSGSGGGSGWSETGSGTMTTSGLSITLAKKPQFVFGELEVSSGNIIQYYFNNIYDEYTDLGKNESCFLLRPGYNTYGKGASYVDYDGDKTITFVYGNWGENGKTVNWVALYAE